MLRRGFNLMPRTEKADSAYAVFQEPDGPDPRGPFRKIDTTAHGKGGRFATTANLSHDQLAQLSDEVGPNRMLLVLCTAFRSRRDQFPNLTIKKIPRAVLSRCEWGHDDYSLQVENLPRAPPEPGQQELFRTDDENSQEV